MASSEDMQTFYFKAGVPEGGVSSGELVAVDEAHAIAQLRLAGFLPIRIETQKIRESFLQKEIGFTSSKRLNLADGEAFCREIALLLRAGLELIDAVSIIAATAAPKAKLGRFTTSLMHGMRLGLSFSDAISKSNFDVPDNMISVISSGEQTGALPEALAMLAKSYAESGQFSRTFVNALVYPIFLLAVAILTLAVIAFFVAPNLAALFDAMDKPTPFAIGALNAVSIFLSQNLLLVSIAIILAIVGPIFVASNVEARQRLKALWFSLPVVGDALRWSATQKFATTLKLYLAANITMSTALPNAFLAAGFPRASSRASQLGEDIRGGGQLASAVTKLGVFPPKALHLIGVGERSGRLDEVLSAVADEAQLHFGQRMALVSSLLAPVLILAVGAFIGSIIFSVFSALLEINNLAF